MTQPTENLPLLRQVATAEGYTIISNNTSTPEVVKAYNASGGKLLLECERDFCIVEWIDADRQPVILHYYSPHLDRNHVARLMEKWLATRKQKEAFINALINELLTAGDFGPFAADEFALVSAPPETYLTALLAVVGEGETS
jgi:hypothetical protein